MPTNWLYPNAVSQYCEVAQHIAWVDDGSNFYNLRNQTNTFVSTVKQLAHIANTYVNDVKQKTYYLSLTNFAIASLPPTISGLEAMLGIDRGARITDDVIQLQYLGQPLGENLASDDLSIIKNYGGEGVFWGTTLTPTIISDPSFGATLRFQSHPSWPHNVAPRINYFVIRVW